MNLAAFIGDWHALAMLFVAGVVPNQIWRMLGLWFGGGLDEGSEILVWVRAVATVPDLLRYAAVAAGFIAFALTRRSIFAGVVTGELVMLAGTWWLG